MNFLDSHSLCSLPHTRDAAGRPDANQWPGLWVRKAPVGVLSGVVPLPGAAVPAAHQLAKAAPCPPRARQATALHGWLSRCPSAIWSWSWSHGGLWGGTSASSELLYRRSARQRSGCCSASTESLSPATAATSNVRDATSTPAGTAGATSGTQANASSAGQQIATIGSQRWPHYIPPNNSKALHTHLSQRSN